MEYNFMYLLNSLKWLGLNYFINSLSQNMILKIYYKLGKGTMFELYKA